MSKKIIKIKQDTEFFLDRARKKYEQGELSSSLSFLHRASMLSPDNYAIRYDIATTYADMGLYEYGLRELIRLLSAGKEDAEVYKEIIKCYFEMELFDQALYFYKEALRCGAFTDNDLEDFVLYEDDMMTDIQFHDKRDNSNILQLSHKLMLSGDLNFAKQLMTTIPDDSYQYIDAANSLAVIALSSGAVAEAIAHSEKVLSADEENVYAISHLIIAYDMLGNLDKMNEYLDILIQMDISKMNELQKAALCMQQISNNEMALKFLEKILQQLPYSREHLIAGAVACNNLGRKSRAKELIVRAYRIYPEDIAVRYYARIINRSDEKTNLTILSSIPQDLTIEWVKEIEDWIRKGALKGFAPKCFLPGGELKEKILWVFQSADWKMQGTLGAFLAKSSYWEPFLRDLLIDPYFDFRAKKECLQALLKYAKSKDFDLFITDMFLSFAPKIPKGIAPMEMRDAYWQVYATLAFIGNDFDLKLNKAFKQLVRRYNTEDFIRFKMDVNVLSALLLYRVNMKHIFKSKIDCCEIFNSDLTDFEVYSDIFLSEDKEFSDKNGHYKAQK